MDELTTFSFDERKVATLTLEQFMLSGRLEDPNKPEEERVWDKPHDFFVKIQEILTEMDIPFYFGDVFVSRKGADYLADPLQKNLPKTELKRWAFNTLVTRVVLVTPEQANLSDFNPAIGIGFTEQGVQVCLGTEVRVCSNMSIFGEYFIKSYGQNSMTMEQLFRELKVWLTDVDRIQKENIRILEKLTGIPITSKGGIQKLIGQLSLARELTMAGYPHPAPMDKDEIAEFQKRIIQAYGDVMANEHITDLCWLYNVCTNILTHSERNFHNKWEDVFKMGEFICEHYDVFEEEVEPEPVEEPAKETVADPETEQADQRDPVDTADSPTEEKTDTDVDQV